MADKVVVVAQPHNFWGTASGAGIGALIGTSVFPVIGTAVGAVAGAFAGYVMRDQPLSEAAIQAKSYTEQSNSGGSGGS